MYVFKIRNFLIIKEKLKKIYIIKKIWIRKLILIIKKKVFQFSVSLEVENYHNFLKNVYT